MNSEQYTMHSEQYTMNSEQYTMNSEQQHSPAIILVIAVPKGAGREVGRVRDWCKCDHTCTTSSTVKEKALAGREE